MEFKIPKILNEENWYRSYKIDDDTTHVQFNSLHFGFSPIPYIDNLFDQLITKNQILSIQISNTLFYSKTNKLLNVLRMLPNIYELELGACHFTGKILKNLSKFLADNQTLQSLSLKIDHLILLENNSVNEFSENLGNHTSLKRLILEGEINQIVQSKNFFRAVAKIKTLKIFKLDLEKNNVGDKQIIFLFNSFLGNQTIQEISLTSIRKISNVAIVMISTFLTKNYTLQGLHLNSDEMCFDDEGLMVLSQAIKNHPTLNSIIIKESFNSKSNNRIGDFGVQALFSSLGPAMVEIELSAPKITYKGMREVLELVKHKKSLFSILSGPDFPEGKFNKGGINGGGLKIIDEDDPGFKKNLNAPAYSTNRDLHKDLCTAFKKKDYKAFERLLSDGAAPFTDIEGDPHLLHSAVLRNDLHFAEMLINSPFGSSMLHQLAGFDARNLYGWLTPLEVAQKLELKDMYQLLTSAIRKERDCNQISLSRRSHFFKEWFSKPAYLKGLEISEMFRLRVKKFNLKTEQQPQQLTTIPPPILFSPEELAQLRKLIEKSHQLERRKEILNAFLIEIAEEPQLQEFYQKTRLILDGTVHSLRAVYGKYVKPTNDKTILIDIGQQIMITAGIFLGGYAGAGTEVASAIFFTALQLLNEIDIYKLARKVLTIFPNSSSTGELIDIITILLTIELKKDILSPPKLQNENLFSKINIFLKAKLEGSPSLSNLDYLILLTMEKFLNFCQKQTPYGFLNEKNWVEKILSELAPSSHINSHLNEIFFEDRTRLIQASKQNQFLITNTIEIDESRKSFISKSWKELYPKSVKLEHFEFDPRELLLPYGEELVPSRPEIIPHQFDIDYIRACRSSNFTCCFPEQNIKICPKDSEDGESIIKYATVLANLILNEAELPFESQEGRNQLTFRIRNYILAFCSQHIANMTAGPLVGPLTMNLMNIDEEAACRVGNVKVSFQPVKEDNVRSWNFGQIRKNRFLVSVEIDMHLLINGKNVIVRTMRDGKEEKANVSLGHIISQFVFIPFYANGSCEIINFKSEFRA